MGQELLCPPAEDGAKMSCLDVYCDASSRAADPTAEAIEAELNFQLGLQHLPSHQSRIPIHLTHELPFQP